MSALTDPPSGLREFEFSDKFRFLYPPETWEHHRNNGSSPMPLKGEDPWIVGAVADNDPAEQIACEATELTYAPQDSRELKRSYRKNYRQIIGSLQDATSLVSEERSDAEQEILRNTISNMSERDIRLLGGFCVARVPESSEVLTAVFYSEVLEACYKRVMRETALLIDSSQDIPKDARTEKTIEYLDKLTNLEEVNEIAVSCGVMIASFLPHPATISPQFGKGKRPPIPGHIT